MGEVGLPLQSIRPQSVIHAVCTFHVERLNSILLQQYPWYLKSRGVTNSPSISRERGTESTLAEWRQGHSNPILKYVIIAKYYRNACMNGVQCGWGIKCKMSKRKKEKNTGRPFYNPWITKTPLAEVSRKIKIVQRKKPIALHPDPTKEQRTHAEWADPSSYDCLPLWVRSALAPNARNRIGKIEAALLDPNVSDNCPSPKRSSSGAWNRQALVHPAWMCHPRWYSLPYDD
ncbi:hypothetical protein GWK47_038373 [Chionoecetes opilio]|uniref:Uncharacterized protein n=1 Tax=Chionoecetes opilio TaxID=41210 RepID=A0A8J4YFG9_CHIOP|nr:hypothetical protein GWK47_038373 [Chionoecetes opilio]